MGPRAGRKVLTLVECGELREPHRLRDVLCANVHGFSLHAGVRCDANDRKGIEQLCRYITRPAIANERLSINREGNMVLKLKTAYRNGTTHIVMSPMEFMQRLAALVPRPRLHLIRPALAVPMGFCSKDLPLSLQIAAKPFDEAMVFRVAHAYEQATTWHLRHPDVAKSIAGFAVQ